MVDSLHYFDSVFEGGLHVFADQFLLPLWKLTKTFHQGACFVVPQTERKNINWAH